ncbi:muscle M-line assembly protein unc-89-like [Diaphorina citri]|uniref:Muscle M-line assembly protein unc-89-like n=1 Tax=Diaphorina citri TaxID=121845 RepID=A0A3Q0ITU5_DIACI|nr:muscle M-line assembly protein unc-89-like [Diaphorina citri]
MANHLGNRVLLSWTPALRLICRVSINPSASHIAADSAAVGGFLNYLSDLVIVQTVEDILPPTQIVGNIRFTHPTLYVFPGGHGDAALFGKPKRPDSPGKYKLKELAKRPPTGAVYVDLAYIPHHGHTSYTNAEFFKKIRARHYVFSGIEPSKNVFNALLEAKQTWEDKDLVVVGLKGTEKLPSPPKSPVEKSKEDAKPSTPPKSPTVKTEEKLGSPPKTPTEKSSGVEKLSSPPKSPTIKSKEEQPPKSPTEKSKDVTSSPKTQTEKSSPPKSPVDKSKDTEPPKSPANKSEEKTVTPPKSPVEKSTTEAVSPQKSSTDKASEGEHSSPRKSLVDETEGKQPSPSKTPAEKPSETEMVSSPLKSPADKSKELEKHETPPKSPVEKPKEKLATPPKTPTEKSSEVSLEKSKDIEKLQTSAGSTEKSEAKDTFSTSPKTAPDATKEAEKLKTPPKSPEATSTKDKLVTPPNTPVEKSLKVDTPPKTPTDKSIEVDKLDSPPKSPKEKSKEAESPTKSSKDTILPSSSARNIETSITNGAEKIIDGEVHSKVDSTPKSSTEPKESETKHSTPDTVQDTGKQNGSVASFANIGEHKVMESNGEKPYVHQC